MSGVLSVVAAGLVRGRYAPEIVSAEMRIMARSVWNVLVFILNSLIFILIGVQMSGVMDKLHWYSLSELFMLGSVIKQTPKDALLWQLRRAAIKAECKELIWL